MTDHANELRRLAGKIGRQDGDVPAVMHAAAAHIEHLERELRAAEIRLHDVATHCATVEADLAEIKRRTYVAVTCNHVARMERAEARVAELEAELSDDHWPHGATVKLRRVGLGYFEKHGWAKRDAEGQLITVCSGARLDESMWEVVQELKVKPARGEG